MLMKTLLNVKILNGVKNKIMYYINKDSLFLIISKKTNKTKSKKGKYNKNSYQIRTIFLHQKGIENLLYFKYLFQIEKPF